MNEAKIHRESYTFKKTLTAEQLLLIRYASVFVVSFIIGLVGYCGLKVPLSERLNAYIDDYFSCSFNFENTLSFNCEKLFSSSYADMKTMVLIFIAGFTMFSSVAIYWLLFSQAVSLGFSSLYLVNAISGDVLLKVNFFDLLIFLLLSAAISSMMILFGSKTRIFNDHFRSLGNRKKLIIRSKPLYKQIFTLLTLCGAIILINSMRFIINTL